MEAPVSPVTKQCRKCDTVKQVSEFGNDKSRPDGKFPWCRNCKSRGNAKYRVTHAEQIAQGKRRCYEANREAYAESHRRWRESNRERKAQTDADYYRLNRSRILAYVREWKGSRLGNRPADKPWPDAPCGYTAAHDRVRAVKGLARWHPCVDCATSAEEWSYLGGADAELSEWGTNPRGEPILRPYSPDPDDYEPRCIPCHRKFDRSREVYQHDHTRRGAQGL